MSNGLISLLQIHINYNINFLKFSVSESYILNDLY
jgi:hypothetical protein